MVELYLVFVSGILGSAHCIGMCGPIALSLGTRWTKWRGNLSGQLIYSVGRIFTYAVLGATAGYFGWKLTGAGSQWLNIPAVLAILAGLVLLWQGLASLGWLPWRKGTSGEGACLGASFFGPLLRLPGWSGVFIAGIFTGFLPCGLVYAFLAMAASTGTVWNGAATMVAFGLGTVPVMVAIGCGSMLFSSVLRQRIYKLAAICVLVSGILCVARGVGYARFEQDAPAGKCPFCEKAESK